MASTRMKFIIMAGGQGTKLWPLSKENYPKQFSNIIGGKSLFQRNLEDLLSAYPPEDIFVSTTEAYQKYAEEQAPMLPKSHFIYEPHIKRDNGPACCYVLAHMLEESPDEVVNFYVQPVVIREPREKYLQMLNEMELLVKRHGKLMTGGMQPTHPEVGSDYISLGPKLKDTGNVTVHYDNKYVERAKTITEAKKMLDEMELVIHCNHWTWTPRGFFESLKKHRPDWYDVTMEIYELIKSDADYDEIRKTYSKYEPGKVELFTQKVYDDEGVQVVILPFKWIHITTWNDVYEYLNQIRKSTLQGKTVHVKSKNNIVINDTDAVVGLLGLEDIVVVKTEDALLICPKNMSGQIKDLLSEIESQGHVDHL